MFSKWFSLKYTKIYLKAEPTDFATQQHITSLHRYFFDYNDKTECLVKTAVNSARCPECKCRRYSYLYYARLFRAFFALNPRDHLHHFLINALLIFGSTPFGWLQPKTLPTVYETHAVKQG